MDVPEVLSETNQQPVLFDAENMVLRGIRNFSVFNVNTIA